MIAKLQTAVTNAARVLLQVMFDRQDRKKRLPKVTDLQFPYHQRTNLLVKNCTILYYLYYYYSTTILLYYILYNITHKIPYNVILSDIILT